MSSTMTIPITRKTTFTALGALVARDLKVLPLHYSQLKVRVPSFLFLNIENADSYLTDSKQVRAQHPGPTF